MVIMMLLVIEIKKFIIPILSLDFLGGLIIGESVTVIGILMQVISGNIIQVLGQKTNFLQLPVNGQTVMLMVRVIMQIQMMIMTTLQIPKMISLIILLSRKIQINQPQLTAISRMTMVMVFTEKIIIMMDGLKKQQVIEENLTLLEIIKIQMMTVIYIQMLMNLLAEQIHQIQMIFQDQLIEIKIKMDFQMVMN